MSDTDAPTHAPEHQRSVRQSVKAGGGRLTAAAVPDDPLLVLQRFGGNQAVARMVSASRAAAAPGGQQVGPRRCACGGIVGPEGECAACRAKRLAGLSVQRAPLVSPHAPVPAAAWLVEDGVTDLQPGQMPKSLWLAELQTALCARADAELKPTGRSAQGCPVLGFYIGYFAGRPASEIAAAVMRYAPETAGVTDARDAIGPITERVGTAVAVWATSGRITGLPEGLGSGVPTAPEQPPDVQRKECGGAPGGHSGAEPRALLRRLGEGGPLDAGVRSRIEPLFGRELSGVRVHHDNTAASLSSGLDARAFTVGNHIALGAGEYQPGTIDGDALLAHELAHVIQQSGSSAGAAPLRDASPAYEAFEHDADTAATGVVASLWGAAKASLANTGPRLRSGLAVQRCSHSVKRCRHPGWSWQVKATYGMGAFSCACAWQCMPGMPSYARYANDPYQSNQSSEGPAPPVDLIDEDVVRTYDNAHFTLVDRHPTCGCIPLDVEGAQIGTEQIPAPLPSGAS